LFGGESQDDLRGGSVTDRVPISRLQAQIAKLAQIVRGDALNETNPNGFSLTEIKILAEVTASGELGFVVAGFEAEAKGSIELTFRRGSRASAE
jgi:hypothetical protein